MTSTESESREDVRAQATKLLIEYATSAIAANGMWSSGPAHDTAQDAIVKLVEGQERAAAITARNAERIHVRDEYAAGYFAGVDANANHAVDGALYKRGKAAR